MELFDVVTRNNVFGYRNSNNVKVVHVRMHLIKNDTDWYAKIDILQANVGLMIKFVGQNC